MDAFELLEDLSTLKVAPKPWMVSGKYKLIRGTADTLSQIIDECIASGRYGCDLETTGLDRRVFNGETRDRIVGICLCPNETTGYYIPLRHKKGMEHNVPWSVFVREMKRLLASDAVPVFHNGKFDHEFLQFNGGDPLGEWDDPKKWDDTLILAYLWDSCAKERGLKFLARTELDMEMIELEELFPEDVRKRGELDFSELDPSWEPVTWYGAADGLCTLKLYHVLLPRVVGPQAVPNQAFVYGMEKLCVASVRWMERPRILTDQEKCKELFRMGQREWFESLTTLYEGAGVLLGRDIRPGFFRLLQGDVVGNESYKFDPEKVSPSYKDCVDEARKRAMSLNLDPQDPMRRGKPLTVTLKVPSLIPERRGALEDVEFPTVYDVLSAQQLGSLLRECGVPGLKVTEKSGQVATSKDDIDEALENAGDKFPFANKIKRFRNIEKALGTYLSPILNDKADDNTLSFSFNQFRVETGRFSVSASRNPARDGGTSLPLHGLPATYDKSRPECLLRIRECVIARPGKFIVACVAKGELVATARGLIPIENVRAGDRVVTDAGLKPVEWTAMTGTKPVSKLTTARGITVRLTDDHRVYTVGDDGFAWKQVSDMRPGDWVVHAWDRVSTEPVQLPPEPTVKKGEVPINVPKTMTPELAEFLGMFILSGATDNEGGKPGRLGFKLGKYADELLPRVNGWTASLFDAEFRRSTTRRVFCDRAPLGRWLDAVTEGVLSESELRIPTAILRGGPEIHAAFLRGVFDVRAILNRQIQKGVNLWFEHERFAREIQILLTGLGIHASRRPCIYRNGERRIDGDSVTVLGYEFLVRLRDVVGFTIPYKRERLDALIVRFGIIDGKSNVPVALARKAVPGVAITGTGVGIKTLRELDGGPTVDREWMDKILRGGLLFDRVRSITPDGESDVYDVHVPDGSRFLVNTIICHNCDFSGVELRIATNLSREPKWLREFFHCSSCDLMFESGEPGITPEAPPKFCPRCGGDKIGDLHTLTAISLFGEDAPKTKEWKQLRQTAKIINFLLVYGGSGNAVSRTTGVDKNEGFRIQETFVKTYKVLKGWWDLQHKFARENGYVLTAFGRKYPLPDITHEEKFIRAKAERNAVNSPVQGCLHPDTRILTSKGLMTVKNLWDRQRAGEFPDGFQIWTGTGWSQGRALYSGEKPIRETVFDRGLTSKTSPEHRFRTWGENGFEWTPQSELRTGMWVATTATEGDSEIPGSLARQIVQIASRGKGAWRSWLNHVPAESIPAHITTALKYDFVRVRELRDPNESIEMYDIEVYDNDHAFIADGVVTHNTSADITKLAMGLVYVECKRRGWLDKVHMLITMHDELVFEIDADILEEAIDVIVKIMNRNPAILKLGWPVPLTSDVEIGHSWAVPWDLKDIRKTGEVPPDLAGCFSGTRIVTETDKKAKAENAPARKVRVYRIAGFSLGEVEALSKLLAGGGDAELKIESPTGEDLTPVFRTFWGDDIPKVQSLD